MLFGAPWARAHSSDQGSLYQKGIVTKRLVTIPFWYNDPWSDECARAHGAPNNMDYLADINNTTVHGVIAAHSGTEWWVTSVGFQPGCYQALSLDPAFSVTAPKYPRPRQ